MNSQLQIVIKNFRSKVTIVKRNFNNFWKCRILVNTDNVRVLLFTITKKTLSEGISLQKSLFGQ